MRRKLVIGNWKMNGTLESSVALAKAVSEGSAGLRAVEVVVCPPFPFISFVQSAISGSSVRCGGQDVSSATSGAYTGQVGASMLKEIGCQYVLVGHSERRHGLGESSVLVAEKAQRALDCGITPVVCVGETLAERESGNADHVVLEQLDAVRAKLGASLSQIILAYEPVWAIGTGKTASASDAQAIHASLRKRLDASGALSVPILYGGSVKVENANQLFSMPEIDGGLIGGAALDASAFLAICAARQIL